MVKSCRHSSPSKRLPFGGSQSVTAHSALLGPAQSRPAPSLASASPMYSSCLSAKESA